MAVGENNHNLLAITSTYHIFNTLKRPLTDICQFWGTATLFSLVKVHQKVRKFATKQPKLAKIENNSERPVDVLAVEKRDSLTDNLKSRDASASKKQ